MIFSNIVIFLNKYYIVLSDPAIKDKLLQLNQQFYWISIFQINLKYV